MQVIEGLRTAARAVDATVVFPEGEDWRILQAAAMLTRERIVRPVLLGDPAKIVHAATEAEADLSPSVRMLDPATSERVDDFAHRLYEQRKTKGMSHAEAKERARDPLVFAAMLVCTGEAGGCVAGAAHATREVLQAALQAIGLAEGIRVASSVFLMILPDGRPLTFGDCAVVPDPDADQLAAIAVASARTHQRLTGETPVVAMLSFSTKGSAEHDAVKKVREATALARQMVPDLVVDGELQFDAAYVEGAGRQKAPGSAVAGRANVFVFPNLDAGNIAYKITERLGGAQAIGPIIQGLAKPMHDLSRGCKVEDIVTLSAICALQAKGEGESV
ncbi:MAG: phosphate acetyltransferase [Candidatus Methylomirabilales bacterium]